MHAILSRVTEVTHRILSRVTEVTHRILSRVTEVTHRIFSHLECVHVIWCLYELICHTENEYVIVPIIDCGHDLVTATRFWHS